MNGGGELGTGLGFHEWWWEGHGRHILPFSTGYVFKWKHRPRGVDRVGLLDVLKCFLVLTHFILIRTLWAGYSISCKETQRINSGNCALHHCYTGSRMTELMFSFTPCSLMSFPAHLFGSWPGLGVGGGGLPVSHGPRCVLSAQTPQLRAPLRLLALLMPQGEEESPWEWEQQSRIRNAPAPPGPHTGRLGSEALTGSYSLAHLSPSWSLSLLRRGTGLFDLQWPLTASFGAPWGKWKSEVSQSCPTLCDHKDCSLPGSSIHGIFQARVLEWVATSFSRKSSQPRVQTRVSRIAGGFFTI